MGALNSQENTFSVYYSVLSHVNTDYRSHKPLSKCLICSVAFSVHSFSDRTVWLFSDKKEKNSSD